MKRNLFFVVMVAVAVLLFAGNTMASPEGVSVLGKVADSYYPEVPVTIEDLGNNFYKITGPGGTEDIEFTPRTIKKLDEGKAIVNACQKQAEQFRRVMEGPDVKPACLSCWPNNPKGQYRSIWPNPFSSIGAKETLININNKWYPDDTVTIKWEVLCGEHIKKVLARNPARKSPKMMLEELQEKILCSSNEMNGIPLPSASKMKDGKSCWERTWFLDQEGNWQELW